MKKTVILKGINIQPVENNGWEVEIVFWKEEQKGEIVVESESTHNAPVKSGNVDLIRALEIYDMVGCETPAAHFAAKIQEANDFMNL